MKRYLILLVAAVVSVVVSGCFDSNKSSFADGVYRGAFFDRGEMEINIQFTLKSDTVTNISYRYLHYKGVDYLDSDEENTNIVYRQYRELAEYLIDRDIRESLDKLFNPSGIITIEADGVTGATIRSAKLISAIRDGLNRGVYRKL
ncbi:hypothetical protein CHISP_2726 [Chitinispirillum alkaliphilum]|nr:hypothetical protein CHISP_2726 [Chitinispirillum alkaliphilum]